MPMNKEEIDKLLAKPNVAVVAVTAPDGAPHAVPIWYEYRDGEVVFHTFKSSFKCRCLAHDPRITLCVDTREPPYKAVILKGRATMEQRSDEERQERIAVAYLGEEAGRAYAAYSRSLKDETPVIVSFRPAHIISWDYSQEMP